jgi:hypothetical protein
MADILSHSQRKSDDPVEWTEDATSLWRAVALFGGLAALAGFCLSSAVGNPSVDSACGTALLGVGGFILFFSVWVGAAVGGPYLWAMLGGSGLSMALGVYILENSSISGASLNLTGIALELGGATLLIAGVATSILVSRRQDERWGSSYLAWVKEPETGSFNRGRRVERSFSAKETSVGRNREFD